MRRPLPEIKENLSELKTQLRKEKNARRKLRLHLLVLLKAGKAKTRSAAAEILAVHRNSIRNWLNLYESGGLITLLKISSPGAPAGQKTFSEAQLNCIREYLAASKEMVSYVELQAWIKQHLNMDVEYKTLWRIVRHELKARPRFIRKAKAP